MWGVGNWLNIFSHVALWLWGYGTSSSNQGFQRHFSGTPQGEAWQKILEALKKKGKSRKTYAFGSKAWQRCTLVAPFTYLDWGVRFHGSSWKRWPCLKEKKLKSISIWRRRNLKKTLNLTLWRSLLLISEAPHHFDDSLVSTSFLSPFYFLLSSFFFLLSLVHTFSTTTCFLFLFFYFIFCQTWDIFLFSSPIFVLLVFFFFLLFLVWLGPFPTVTST